MSQLITSHQIEEVANKVAKYAEDNPIVIGASAVLTLFAAGMVMRKADMKRNSHDYDNQLTGAGKILNNSDHTLKKDEFSSSINDYEGMFDGARKSTGAITSEESVEVRKKRYADMVNHFYNLVTDFYEWGWGQSFHFAPRFHDETFIESIKRAEYHLCSRLGMKPGMRALDVGCGVGGPMRNMAIFSGSFIDGITINQYQVNIGNKYNRIHGLDHLCTLYRGDFQQLTEVFKDKIGTFDVAYEIEATCHSPDRVQTFGGVAKLLKPGGLFAGYDWVTMDKYDKNNKDHVRIKEGIEVGNGLPTICHYTAIRGFLEAAGFDVLEEYDANRNLHNANEIPWYDTLNGKMSLSGFRMTHIGRMVTHSMVWTLEMLCIAPKGSTQVSALLNATALDLCEGGQLEIFTPSYYFLAKKR